MCLRACISEQSLQSLNILLKDAILYLLNDTGFYSAHESEWQTREIQVCIFPKDKLLVILEYLEFQKERLKEKKPRTKSPHLTHDRVRGIIPPLSIRLTDPHSFRLTTSKTGTPGGNQGTLMTRKRKPYKRKR